MFSNTVAQRLTAMGGISACVYFAVLPVSGASVRSVAFAVAAVFTLAAIAASRLSTGARIPSPGRFLVATFVFWSAWSCASLIWSVDASYSLAEIRTEIGWGALTIAIFYVATDNARAWRVLVATGLTTAAILNLLAIGLYVGVSAFDPEQAFSRFHVGVGTYSTFIVLMLPFVPFVVTREPLGFGHWRGARWVAAILLLNAFYAARLTENRMTWVAVGVTLVVCALIAARRWPAWIQRKPTKRFLLAALSIALVAWLFAGAVEQRMRANHAPALPWWHAFVDDPRVDLWRYLAENIAERPWLGYGFGKSILREPLAQALHDPLLTHAHNMFASQWLQTGVVGLAAFVLLLGALVRRYVEFLRGKDNNRALIGLAGVALVTAFCVKGLTDDILHRSSSKEFWALNAMLLALGTRLEAKAHSIR